MDEDFGDVRRNITLFLLSLRQSIDRPFRGRAPAADGERERFMNTMLMVEEARIRFNTYTRYREEPTLDEWETARKELLNFINTFINSPEIDPAVYNRRFIISSALQRDREQPSPFVLLFVQKEERPILADALIIFRSYLEELNTKLAPTQGSLSFVDLDRIVPRQQVAPVHFGIVDGRIVVADRSPIAAEADKANIKSALEHIRGSGDHLIRNLETSNCDRRLLESVRELQSQLTADANIVKIGLTNMACGVMCAQFQRELPDALNGMLNAYNASISLYVAQFKEWDQFTQKAAAIDLDEDDVAEVDMAAADLIATLNKNPDLADPEVPKTISFIRQFLSFPGNSSKRAAFAMIRTIENLVSSIIRHSLNFFGQTAEKLVDAGSTAVSKMIIGLLGIALMSASGIGPAAVRAGAPWVKQAADIVQKQIEKASE
ncbi:hypothetical protein [Mesorhizobium sp. IMUNJ 23232]|uniref:hypothetical protein n=1 Tax=Mesorhizobium sp. IMUNJ 23232 TaxID=3376064 RepID=UPI00379347E7